MTSQLTTHVLDAMTGAPAAGVDVALRSADGAVLARGTTNDDGRLALGPDHLSEGSYELTFATGAYFAATGTPAFYPSVTITVAVDEAAAHYHVPLLLSPFAYSTYRGS